MLSGQVLQGSSPEAGTGLVARLVQGWASAKRRLEAISGTQRLLASSDEMLKDIGFSRAEVACQPFFSPYLQSVPKPRGRARPAVSLGEICRSSNYERR